MKEEQEKKNKVIQNIKRNYKQVEQSIVEQLYMKHDLHGTTIGSMREDTWKELFQMVLPKKFVMEQSIFIIDSGGGISREVDLAIMDETYTPYIFRYGRIKFIPIEAVAVVVECKSKEINRENIDNWCDQISNLRTARGSIVRLATYIETGTMKTQQSTRPIRILCKLDTHVDEQIEKRFDFVIYAREANENQPHAHLEIKRNTELSNLWMWFKELNFYKEDPKNTELGRKELEDHQLKDYEILDNGKINALLTFNMQLNQLLMLINNPMLFPHQKYVEMFNKFEEANNEQDCSDID